MAPAGDPGQHQAVRVETYWLHAERAYPDTGSADCTPNTGQPDRGHVPYNPVPAKLSGSPPIERAAQWAAYSLRHADNEPDVGRLDRRHGHKPVEVWDGTEASTTTVAARASSPHPRRPPPPSPPLASLAPTREPQRTQSSTSAQLIGGATRWDTALSSLASPLAQRSSVSVHTQTTVIIRSANQTAPPPPPPPPPPPLTYNRGHATSAARNTAARTACTSISSDCSRTQ